MLASAMIMAAGRGERMRPLTDTCPKPLLAVHGKPLLQYHLDAFARAGYRDVVVNTAWLGDQLEARFGSGDRPRIVWSREGRDFGGALETAGGIARALPLLAEVFWLVAGDVYAPQFEFGRDAMARFEASGKLAHVVLVPNPPQHPQGDFGLRPDGLALSHAPQQFTYSTIGLYRQAFFASMPHGNPHGVKGTLAPLLRAAMDNGQVTAEIHTGAWADVGTPQRLAQLNAS
jgi:MurNAc alpha-1-phosphate uridylyltransferase